MNECVVKLTKGFLFVVIGWLFLMVGITVSEAQSNDKAALQAKLAAGMSYSKAAKELAKEKIAAMGKWKSEKVAEVAASILVAAVQMAVENGEDPNVVVKNVSQGTVEAAVVSAPTKSEASGGAMYAAMGAGDGAVVAAAAQGLDPKQIAATVASGSAQGAIAGAAEKGVSPRMATQFAASGVTQGTAKGALAAGENPSSIAISAASGAIEGTVKGAIDNGQSASSLVSSAAEGAANGAVEVATTKEWRGYGTRFTKSGAEQREDAAAAAAAVASTITRTAAKAAADNGQPLESLTFSASMGAVIGVKNTGFRETGALAAAAKGCRRRGHARCS